MAVVAVMAVAGDRQVDTLKTRGTIPEISKDSYVSNSIIMEKCRFNKLKSGNPFTFTCPKCLKIDLVNQITWYLNYNLKSIRAGQKVKPIYLTKLPKDIKTLGNTKVKRELFIQIVLPLILYENEKIIADLHSEKDKIIGDLPSEEEEMLPSPMGEPVALGSSSPSSGACSVKDGNLCHLLNEEPLIQEVVDGVDEMQCEPRGDEDDEWIPELVCDDAPVEGRKQEVSM